MVLAKVDDVKFDSERAREKAKGAVGIAHEPTDLAPWIESVNPPTSSPAVAARATPVLPALAKDALARGEAPDAWGLLISRQLVSLMTFRRLAERALTLLGTEEERARKNLEEMRDRYAYAERELPALFERFERERPAASPTTHTPQTGNSGEIGSQGQDEVTPGTEHRRAQAQRADLYSRPNENPYPILLLL